MYLKNINKNIFFPLNFLKKYKCFLCHNIKKNIKISAPFLNANKKKLINYKLKKYLFKKIKNGSRNIFKKNIIMPSFNNIKKKYIYFFVKWIVNFK